MRRLPLLIEVMLFMSKSIHFCNYLWRRRMCAVGTALTLLSVTACTNDEVPSGGAAAPPPTSPSLTSEREQFSYAVGQRIGANLVAQGLDVDADAFSLALQDALTGTAPRLTEETMSAVLSDRQQQARAEAQEQAADNLLRGQQFLQQNKSAAGIIELASGLQYKVLHAGDGQQVQSGDEVTVHYTGTTIDGSEFDSSRSRGEPAVFTTTSVIPGWQEALALMHVGDHWQVFIPAALAYGEQGAGDAIGPNETLVFDIELLGIKMSAGHG